MLTFDDQVWIRDSNAHLWATSRDGTNRRVRFTLGPDVLANALRTAPVNAEQIETAVQKNRLMIEQICKKAYASHLGNRINITAADFREQL